MPDYSKSKVYRLHCADGHYYVGSTTSSLSTRLQGHKNMSRKEASRVYRHINELGWDKVSIILIEEFSCESRDQLRRREHEIIQVSRDDPLCLNTYAAYRSPEERKAYCADLSKQHNADNRENLREYRKKYRQDNKDALAEYFKQYREQHRERLAERDRQYRLRKKGQV